MEKDCIQLLKEHMMNLASDEQKDELVNIFEKDIKFPESKCIDIDEEGDYFILDDLIDDEMLSILK